MFSPRASSIVPKIPLAKRPKFISALLWSGHLQSTQNSTIIIRIQTRATKELPENVLELSILYCFSLPQLSDSLYPSQSRLLRITRLRLLACSSYRLIRRHLFYCLGTCLWPTI